MEVAGVSLLLNSRPSTWIYYRARFFGVSLPLLQPPNESIPPPRSGLDTSAPEGGRDSEAFTLEGFEMGLDFRFHYRRRSAAEIARHLVQGVEITAEGPPRTKIQKLVPRELRA